MSETPRDLAGRIKAFYDANPGELLTLADLCAKFGVTPDRAKGSLDRLRRRGEVGAMVVYGRMWGEA